MKSKLSLALSSRMVKRANFFRTIPLGLAVLALLFGVLLLASSLLPYPDLKSILDSAARDGSLEIFTPALYRALIPILRWCSLAFLGLGVLSLLFRKSLGAWSERLFQSLAAYSPGNDLRRILEALKPSKSDRDYLILLFGITLLAGAIRGLMLFSPMLHDEAYTYIAFAARPLRYAISDYHLPNNHIFHTLLVFVSTRVLGNHPWTVRLPAYLAGLLTVPAAYGVGRLAYNRSTGLIAAALAAASGALIDYSTNARGYALIALFTLLALIVGDYVRRRPSPLAWGALILFSALGIYTIPIMLYPFGIVMAWLFLSMLAGDINAQSNRKFLGVLVLSGLAVILLSGLLYSPVILIGTGWDSLIGNNFVGSLKWGDFLESLPGRARSAWGLWTRDFPPFAVLLSVIGFALSTALHRRISPHRVPLQLAALLWISVALAFQRVAPLARIWLFLLPLYLIWSAAGWVGLFRLLPQKITLMIRFWTLAALVLAIPVGRLYTGAVAFQPSAENLGLEEQVAEFLEDRLQVGDTVAADAPLRAMLEYYFTNYGISRNYFYRGEESFQHAWVVVGEKYGQSLESVLEREGLMDRVDLDSREVITSIDRAAIYRFKPR